MSNFTAYMQDIVPKGRWDVVLLEDDGDCLSISIKGAQDELVKFVFDSYFCYRKYDEGDAFLSLEEMRITGGLGNLLYIVKDSEFLKWFHTESSNNQISEGLAHYRVATMNDIIDIVSIDPPILQRIT